MRVAGAVVFGVGLMVALLGGAPANGADVDVIKQGAGKTAIELQGTGAGATVIAVLKADLERSGWFSVVGPGRGALRCRVDGAGPGRARCRVDGNTGRIYLDDSFSDPKGDQRGLAHQMADAIVWAVKRVSGVASSRIVLIGSQGGKKYVYVCDADGGNMVRLTRDGAACLAPSWDKGGAGIVYTSFHRGFPDLYRIDMKNYARRRLAGFPGVNAGADIAPNGREMVLTLSKDGNPDLYIMDLGTSRLTRVTRTRYAAEASPSWSPDGAHIAYVSDQSGSPQLYIVSRAGGKPRRISYRGAENVSPDWGPDGRIAYSSRRDGRYHIHVIDPTQGTDQKVTSGGADFEDPSWGRDSRHIVASRTEAYRSTLYVLDTRGDPPIRLIDTQGDWYAPAWALD